MTLIVDASVAVKWVLEEPGSDDAAELLPRAMIAPELLQAEVGHVLTGSVRRKQLSRSQACAGFDFIMRQVALVPTCSSGRAALDLSLTLNHSFYDCYYLVLADQSRRAFVTADAVFVRKLRHAGRGERVYLLGEEVPHD